MIRSGAKQQESSPISANFRRDGVDFDMQTIWNGSHAALGRVTAISKGARGKR